MEPKPNLLFIMTDQQRWDALGCHSNGEVITPTLDKLAATGADLQNYFTNAPVCVPSRCSLFTGRYPHSHRCRENYNLLDPGREFHLFRVLKQAGYRLGYCGKNHLLNKQETVNFEMFDDTPTPEEEEVMNRYRRFREEANLPAGTSEASWRGGWVYDGPREGNRTWRTAQRAIEFIESRNHTEPFALCVSFADPHVPHIALREYFEMYSPQDIEPPPFAGDAELDSKATRWRIKHHAMNAQNADLAAKQRYIAIYRAMVTWVDHQIRRILDTLEARDLRENTLIVFTSDHGDFNFEHGIPKKDLVLVDSLLHVPCILNLPGTIPAGIKPSAFCEEVDLMPTILDLLGIPSPLSVQGRSFTSLFRDPERSHKRAVFAEVCPPYFFCKYRNYDEFAAENGGPGRTPFNVPGDFTKAIRTRRWRYIWYSNGEEELYDHETDPHELKNLAADPDFATIRDQLKMELLEWNALTEDPLDHNLLQTLQQQYSDWEPCPVIPGVQGRAPVELFDLPHPHPAHPGHRPD